MKICQIGPAVFFALILLGCQGCSSRPPNVPSSALHVENTFIVCSADSPSRGNHCTIYGQDAGEILADGLFLTTRTHISVDKGELQYATVGHGMIYLQDGRVLVHVVPSERDPSYKKITENLEALAMQGSSQAIDCNKVSSRRAEDVAECARKSLKERQAFYFNYYWQGDESFALIGIAANEEGTAYEVEYESAWVGERNNLAKNWQVLDDGHILIIPCLTPLNLYRTYGNWLTCRPKVRE
jgi:hypothetical protein